MQQGHSQRASPAAIALYVIMLAAAISLLDPTPVVKAVPANPGKIIVLAQPDGTQFQARLYGDEWLHWYETDDRYTIVRRLDGYWVFAAKSSDGNLIPSNAVVGVNQPPFPKHLRPSQSLKVARSDGLHFPSSQITQISILDTARVVVILIEFTDTGVGEGSAGPHTSAYFGDADSGLVFGSVAGTMGHYYNEVSYDQFAIGGVVANNTWHLSDNSMAYYGADCNPGNCPALAGRNLDNCNVCISELAREAVQKADAAGFDFSPYDADFDGVVDHVVIVHAGHDQAESGAPNDIWSHRYGIVPGEPVDGVEVWAYTMLSEHDAMSVFAHEFMHDLGAPDLYDRDSANTLPVGDWCLMSTFVKSDSPPHICGLLKYDLNANFQDGIVGWASVSQLVVEGVHTVSGVASNQSGSVYITPSFSSNEFFIVENRQQTGAYDVSVPESGIIFTHIDADFVDGGGRIANEGPPTYMDYGAWIERPGGAGTSDNAAYSLDDGETEFTPSTVPSTDSNDGQATGLGFTRISSEGPTMTFKYSTPPVFTDATSGPLGDTGAGFGVAWGDYDGDTDLDVYLSNGSANKLFRNDGAGVFTDVTSGPLGNTSNGRGVAWGDYDNDGDLDLYLANYASANKLFRNDGAGVFTDVTSGPLGDTGLGHNAVWGDYDNDGDVDLYLANEGQANKLFRNDGGDVFVDATSGPLGDTGNSIAAAWADYDNDGDLDLYFTNWFSGTNRLLRNDGSGVFVDVTSVPVTGNGWGTGIAWGDYDNDLDLDLYVVNHNQPNILLRNDGGGNFSDVTTGPLAQTAAGRGAAWADYDNDGDLDLYIANHEGDRNKLLRNDGVDGFVDVTNSLLGIDGNEHGMAWGDYDGDGDLDIYVANAGGANALLRNDVSNGNQWLQVNLVGTTSNQSGIGICVI